VGCGLDSTVSGQGPVAGCCECGDESSGSCVTELVNNMPSVSVKTFITDLPNTNLTHSHANIRLSTFTEWK
jgi:hypothetical protein